MSSHTKDIGDIVHERWLDFSYEFGNNGLFEAGMIKTIRSMERICEIFFGQEAAATGFNRIVRGVFDNHTEEDSWEHILDEEFSGIHSETPVGQLLHDLTAYADHGIVLATARDGTQREHMLRSQIEQARILLDLLPVDLWDLEGEHLIKLIRKAVARWKIDNDEPITAKELAALSGLAMQTIKNKLSGNKEIKGKETGIEARVAITWLSGQKAFKTSIWRDQDDTDALVELDRGLGPVVFLPVAKDGSVFHPGIQRDGKYLIDEDGKERTTEDFNGALASLQSMLFPQWRRPTQEGVWTRVRAVEWRRYGVDELDRLARQTPG